MNIKSFGYCVLTSVKDHRMTSSNNSDIFIICTIKIHYSKHLLDTEKILYSKAENGSNIC